MFVTYPWCLVPVRPLCHLEHSAAETTSCVGISRVPLGIPPQLVTSSGAGPRGRVHVPPAQDFRRNPVWIICWLHQAGRAAPGDTCSPTSDYCGPEGSVNRRSFPVRIWNLPKDRGRGRTGAECDFGAALGTPSSSILRPYSHRPEWKHAENAKTHTPRQQV